MSDIKEVNNLDTTSFEYFQKLETSIAVYLGLSDFRSGGVVIRNERGWRENEKYIDYAWIILLSRSFVGCGGVFAIKFNETKFREYINKEELIHGVFTSTDNGIELIFTESVPTSTFDVNRLFNLNLIDANKGITIDGVCYDIRIFGSNINTFIKVNNPNTVDWKKWENEIWEMGRSLSEKSKNKTLINLFDRIR